MSHYYSPLQSVTVVEGKTFVVVSLSLTYEGVRDRVLNISLQSVTTNLHTATQNLDKRNAHYFTSFNMTWLRQL